MIAVRPIEANSDGRPERVGRRFLVNLISIDYEQIVYNGLRRRGDRSVPLFGMRGSRLVGERGRSLGCGGVVGVSATR